MIERKLKNRKFCQGGFQISKKGSKCAETLGKCKFLKNLLVMLALYIHIKDSEIRIEDCKTCVVV